MMRLGALADACERLRCGNHRTSADRVDDCDEDQMAASFAAGANDFVYPPYTSRELLARIRAHLRRSHEYSVRGEKSEQSLFPTLSIDVSRHEVYTAGHSALLTSKAFGFSRLLAAHAGKAVSRDQLLLDVWNREKDSICDVHTGRLRQKIAADPTDPERIVTVSGHGCKLNP